MASGHGSGTDSEVSSGCSSFGGRAGQTRTSTWPRNAAVNAGFGSAGERRHLPLARPQPRRPHLGFPQND